jgi:Flp pilus assembly protein TadD
MARIHEGLIATVLAGAVVVTGCSDSKTNSGATTQKAQSAAAVPTATSYVKTAAETSVTPAPPAVRIFTPAEGEAAYFSGNFADASLAFEQYTTQHPDRAWGHYMLGLSSWKAGELEKAEKAFDESLRIDPNHVKSLVNRGRVLIELNRSGEALGSLAVAADLDPQSSAVHRLLGRAFAAQGRSDEAEDAYRTAIELDPRDSWSMNNLGLLLLEQGRAPHAVPLLQQAIEIRGDVPAFHNNLGMALEHTGRFRQAAMAYTEALTVDPAYEKAKRNLARVEAVKWNEEPTFSDDAGEQVPAESVVEESEPLAVD